MKFVENFARPKIFEGPFATPNDTVSSFDERKKTNNKQHDRATEKWKITYLETASNLRQKAVQKLPVTGKKATTTRTDSPNKCGNGRRRSITRNH